MNKKIFQILLVAILLFINLKCSEDLLDVSNKNRQTEQLFENMAGLKQYEIGMYATFKGMWDYFYPCYLSHPANEYVFTHTGGEGIMHIEWSSLNPTPTNSFAGFLFGSMYNTIRMSCLIIENGETKKVGDIATAPAAEINKIVGSAYFLRALCHFNLLHTWGKPHDPEDKWGVVIVTDAIVTRGQLQVARSKPSEVYAQIIKDLQKAKELLPLEKDIPALEIGRPTKGAAIALLGKTYLFMKKYDLAKTEFEQFFVENPNKKLLPYFGDNFHGKFENGVESIFEIQYSDLSKDDSWGGGGPGRPFQEYVGSSPFGRGNIKVGEYFMEKFEINDSRKIESAFTDQTDTLFTPEGKMIVHKDSVFFQSPPNPVKVSANSLVKYGPKKYINDHRTSTNKDGLGQYACYENENIMRVAELYEMYAECLAETGDLTKAYEYMNKVRRRAFMYNENTTSQYDYPVGDKTDFYNKIQTEYAKEFIGEQIIWYNWLRWGIAEREVANTGRTFRVGVNEAMPIPDGEIRTNLLSEQNPGY